MWPLLSRSRPSTCGTPVVILLWCRAGPRKGLPATRPSLSAIGLLVYLDAEDINVNKVHYLSIFSRSVTIIAPQGPRGTAATEHPKPLAMQTQLVWLHQLCRPKLTSTLATKMHSHLHVPMYLDAASLTWRSCPADSVPSTQHPLEHPLGGMRACPHEHVLIVPVY